MQQEDYASQNEDWRKIARERVVPFLGPRLPAMEAAHKLLPAICSDVYVRAQEVLGFDSDVVFVIYVGIGCGAGWVTTYQNAPAVLFGLGYLRWGGLAVLLAGIFDFLDGQVARAGRTASPFGALLDSTVDRYSEIFVWFGIVVNFIKSGSLLTSSAT